MCVINAAGQLGSQAIPTSGGIITIDGDAGSVTGSTVSLISNTGSSFGTTKFTGSGTTMQFTVSDTFNNTFLGNNTQTGGAGNGSFNVALGSYAGSVLNGGAAADVCLGAEAGIQLTSGTYNVLIGYQGGYYFTGEGSCIAINSLGNAGASNTLTIGAGTGTGNQQLNRAFISGINGVTSSNPLMVTINSSTDQLGVAAIPSGTLTAVTTSNATPQFALTGTTENIDFNLSNLALGSSLPNVTSAVLTVAYGSAAGAALTTGQANSFIGYQAGTATTTGGNNTAVGQAALSSNLTASNNVAVGSGALHSTTAGGNTAVGTGVLQLNVSGTNNIGIGSFAMGNSITASNNIGIGPGALAGVSSFTGTGNIVIGTTVGANYTAAESYNILIGSSISGVANEVNTLRLGNGTGTGTGQLNQAFISGINGISVTGTAVLVSSTNQLGVTVSSARFKDNIKPLESSRVLELIPSSFTYRVGIDQSPQTGLIAEQVYEIMPELVVLDKEGLPQTVKYNDLPVLLLLEIQKLRKEVDQLKRQ
jgi:hypothetical protein